MIDVQPLADPVFVGSCRPVSYGTALGFAKLVCVPFRLVLSQRVIVPTGEATGVSQLLAGGLVRIPGRRRDALVFANSGCWGAVADWARRTGLLDTLAGVPAHRPLPAFEAAHLSPSVGCRSPLISSYFGVNRSYDLIFDLLPVYGGAFAWRGAGFFAPGADSPRDIPIRVTCEDGSMSAEDFASICAAGRGAMM